MKTAFSSALAALVATGGFLGLATTRAAASLIGDSVEILEYYPAIGDQYGSTVGPLTIASGGTDFGAIGLSLIDAFIDGSQIEFTPQSSYTPSSATFNGFDVRDLSSTIASVSLDATSAPLPSANLFLGGGGHDVLINFSDIAVTAGDPYIIDVRTSVPEASTWAMMALGFAGVASVARRRWRQAVPLSRA
jgi:hypothetical protein